MAFNLSTFATAKYRHSFVSDTGTSRIWEIHEDGFAGSVDTFTASGRSHCTLRYLPQGDDEFFPVLPCEAVISLFDEDDGSGSTKVVEDIYGAVRTTQASDNKYAIVVREGSSILFAGLLDTSDLTYNEDFIPSLTLKASDGYRVLGKVGYVDDYDTGELPTGMASITSIIADCLSETPWGFGFTTATNLYPRTGGTQLAATDNPLDNIYVDKIAFRKKGDDKKPDAPISKADVLNAILTRFLCQIHQEGGVWKIVQVDQKYNGSYREWVYDSAGAAVGSPNYSTVTPTVTPSNEAQQRTPSNISGGLSSYSAVSTTYAHGRATLIKFPDFYGFGVENRNYQIFPTWQTSDNSNAYFLDIGSSKAGIRINDLDGVDWTAKTGYSSVTNVAGEGVANATGTGAGTVHAAIGNYKFTQATEASVPAGTNLLVQLEFRPVSPAAVPDFDGTSNLAVAVQVKSNSTTPKYLQMDGARGASWTTTATWILLENLGPKDAWWNVLIEADGTSLDVGTLDFVLGPIFDNSIYERNAGPRDDVDYVLYSYADIDVELGAGTYNTEATTTTNYVDREDLILRSSVNAIGDGPLSVSSGALFNDSARTDATSDWEEGAITGAASGDSIDKIWTRLVLQAVSNPRRVHSATYFDIGQILTPSNILVRGGSNWACRSLELNLVQDTSTGSWYQARQDGFTDDIEEGTIAGESGGAFLGRFDSSSAGLYQYKLGRSFFTDGARRITSTTAAIPAGSGTASISVNAIQEALLVDGDRIIIFGPDLSVYQVQVSANQLKGATSIAIEDPDNPGSNFSFPEEVPFPANVYFAEDEMLTIARIGEQGFKVSVLGAPLGYVNGAQSGTLTQLTVDGWIASVNSGETVRLSDGTSLVLTSNARPGDTEIYFTSTAVTASDNEEFVNSSQANLSVTAAQVAINVSDISTNAGNISGNTSNISINAGNISTNVTNISTNAGEISTNTGRINVQAGRIDLNIERSEDRIGVITAASVGTTLTVGGGINADLEVGDNILIINKTTGAIQKRAVNTTASLGATSIVLTSAITVAINDVIYASDLVGLRIDFDGIDIVNTSIGSNYSAGSTGWIIKNDGSAEFNNITARGSITATTGAIGGFDIGADYVRDAADTFGLASTVSGSDDVRFWAGDTFANRASAPFSITKAGVLSASSGKVTLDSTGITVNSATGGSAMKFQIGGTTQMSVLAETTGSFDYTIFQANDILWLTAIDPGSVYGSPKLILNTEEISTNLTPTVTVQDAHFVPQLALRGGERVLDSITSDVTVTNSVAETTVFTETITAEVMRAGDIIRVWATGTYGHTATASSMTLKVTLGGTTVATEQFYFPTGSSSSGFGWDCEFFITMRSATSAYGSGRVIFEKQNSVGDQVQLSSSGPTTVSSIATNNLAVALTMTWDVANASNTITAKSASASILQRNSTTL
jgi:hypothetical protein